MQDARRDAEMLGNLGLVKRVYTQGIGNVDDILKEAVACQAVRVPVHAAPEHP